MLNNLEPEGLELLIEIFKRAWNKGNGHGIKETCKRTGKLIIFCQYSERETKDTLNHSFRNVRIDTQ